MATGKKSFIAYADWKNTFDELDNENAGALIKHIFAYVNDESPESDSVLIRAIFANIKATLKRDLDKWDTQLLQRSEAGKKSAELRALNKLNERSTVVDFRARNPTDSVSVSVSDNDIKVNNDLSVNWDALLNQFNSITGKHQKVVDDKVKRQVIARLKSGYSKNDIVTAITNCFNDPYHIENPKYLTLEFISRPDKMATYSQDTTAPKKLIKQQDRL
jgi:hypothetical protein